RWSNGSLPLSAPGTVGGMDILELERAAAAHWRGTEEEWLGDWLLRAAGGFTGRANSALPLGDPGLALDAAVDTVTRWYAGRGLTPMVAVPVPLNGSGGPAAALGSELDRRGWRTRDAPAYVMVADVPAASSGAASPDLPAGLTLRVDATPDPAWLAAYHYRGQADPPPVLRLLLTSAADQVFVSIRDGDAVAAIARVSLAAGWAGITAVEVSPARRRLGLGAALTREAFAQAARHGLDRVFLQVEVDNTAAIRLYERSGFRYSHCYHYRIAPS
ncbi:MAG TPA: GNAT family N-acetyltransferase, partial [Trebonia sp.]|nr:GNAT family N-acetyltransferase [Trebonia sp.]